MTHPYSSSTAVVSSAADLGGLLTAASHHLGAALRALALHDTVAAADSSLNLNLDFCEASLARLSIAETQAEAMPLDTTPMELDHLAATAATTTDTVPAPHLRESPKDRAARRKLHLSSLLHTCAKKQQPPKNPITSSSPATATSDPSAVLLIDRTLAPARRVRARGF